jgi:hypothetical protein
MCKLLDGPARKRDMPSICICGRGRVCNYTPMSDEVLAGIETFLAGKATSVNANTAREMVDEIKWLRAQLAAPNEALRVFALRTGDPANLAKLALPDYLTDAELAGWVEYADLHREALRGTYLHYVLAELRERRDAEAMFVDADLQLQRIADCQACADDLHAPDDNHRAIIKRWRLAQGALCALARIHRGYLSNCAASDGGDLP